jgi:hypothetical protein
MSGTALQRTDKHFCALVDAVARLTLSANRHDRSELYDAGNNASSDTMPGRFSAACLQRK